MHEGEPVGRRAPGELGGQLRVEPPGEAGAGGRLGVVDGGHRGGIDDEVVPGEVLCIDRGRVVEVELSTRRRDGVGQESTQGRADLPSATKDQCRPREEGG